MTKKVAIQLKETSQAIEHYYTNTYEKGNFYCVYDAGTQQVYKYPINNIWRIIEDYGHHGENNVPLMGDTCASDWDTFESVEGDTNVESVTIKPKVCSKCVNMPIPLNVGEEETPNNDPAGILRDRKKPVGPKNTEV